MKRILAISLLLALVLSLIVPTAAFAAKAPVSTSFSAYGEMQTIDNGNVRPLGNTGKWLVLDRHIQGQFVSGDLSTSPFKLTYGGIFDLATQAGNLVGTMQTASGTLLVTGSVAPLTGVYSEEAGGYLPLLSISGNWTGLWGIRASGTFQAYMIFVPTDDGHVKYIVDSAFVMTGNYNGRR
jgi:hypothetical protein